MKASQGGAGGFKLTAEERHLSQRASSQKDRALQNEERPASQASRSQVFLFHQNFLHFHRFWLEKEACDMMLAAVTGYTDALWEASSVVPEHPGGSAGQAKMEKMEKFLVRKEKIPIRM